MLIKPSRSRSISRKTRRFLLEVEMLEVRVVPCVDPLTGLDDGDGDHDEAPGTPAIFGTFPSLVELGGGTTGGSTGGTTSGGPLPVPQLQSKPGASNVLFLDFDGDNVSSWLGYSPGQIPAYNIDSDATTFSTQELANIQAIWQIVAENYSPFNVNVTTIDPRTMTGFSGHVSQMDIGGNGAWTGGSYGGIGQVGGFSSSSATNPVRGFVFEDNLGNGAVWYTAEATSHESGHNMGLWHQSAWSGTTKTAEYQGGPGDGTSPIMGNSYYVSRGMWWYGLSSQGSGTTYQNDLSIVSSTLGYRTDEAGSTASTATALIVSGNTASAAGYITTVSDVDVWSFTTDPGTVSFTVSNQSYGGSKYGNLTPKIELLDSSGNMIVGWQDPNTWTVSWSGVLSGGSYRLVVASHGIYSTAETANNYGFNVGSYTINGTIVTPAGFVAAPSNLTASAVSTSQINLSWADNANNETGYAVERSTNGTTFVQVATLGVNSTSYSDSGLAASSTYYYRVRALGATPSDYSNQTSATTQTPLAPPAAPSNATATAALKKQGRNQVLQVTVRWTDNATNETGYAVQRSSNGGTSWTTLTSSLGANVTSYVDKTASRGTSYIYRIYAFNAAGNSGYATTSALVTPGSTAGVARGADLLTGSGNATASGHIPGGSQLVELTVGARGAFGATYAAASAPEERGHGGPDTSASHYLAGKLGTPGRSASALHKATHEVADPLEILPNGILL